MKGRTKKHFYNVFSSPKKSLVLPKIIKLIYYFLSIFTYSDDIMNESHLAPTAFASDILQVTRQYILQLFNQRQDARLVYHNFQQTAEMIKMVDTIGEGEALTATMVEIASLAAWFYNIGYLFDYGNAREKSIELASKFLRAQDYDREKIKRVLQTLNVFQQDKVRILEQQLFSDAVTACSFPIDYFEKSVLHRLELELVLGQQFSKKEWVQFQMQQLLNTRFFTAHAKVHFEPMVAQHILQQKEILEKTKNTPPNTAVDSEKLRRFQHLEKKNPDRATQTFFRANYRNHINLSAIADNKANIMISVNSILISVLITILTYRNITETNPAVLLPIVVFLMTGLASLIFAVLSARPKVTSLNKKAVNFEQAKRNIIFFGNFVSLDLEQYEAAMDAMFRDGELMYGNMTRDLYYLGKVLEKKYNYLGLSYNIFMIGFVTSVILFLVTLFG